MNSRGILKIYVPVLILAAPLFWTGVSWAQDCSKLTGGQARVVQQLRSLKYNVQCGLVKFPPNPTDICESPGSTGQYSPNPSTCYGSYTVPGRDGSAASATFKLDNDEALVFMGKTPPSSYYFGFQSYVYARVNPLVPLSSSAWVDIFASVGPAINERNYGGVNLAAGNHDPAFSTYTVVASTANKITYNDIQANALPYLYSATPTPEQIQDAAGILNLEMLPVDLIHFGNTSTGDQLKTILRLTPTTVSPGGDYEPDDITYMTSPESVVLRVSPATPRTTGPATDYYDLADDQMPMTKIQPGVNWEQQLLTNAGITDESATLNEIAYNVDKANSNAGLSLVSTTPILSGDTASMGRTCLNNFETLVQEGTQTNDPQLPYTVQGCAGDSADADYVSLNNPQISLASGGQVVIVGVNHGYDGIATYSNVALESPYAYAAARTNFDLFGSANPFDLGLTTSITNYFYEAVFAENCASMVNCMTVPANTPLRLIERAYLNPLTAARPDYTDILFPTVLVFQPQQ